MPLISAATAARVRAQWNRACVHVCMVAQPVMPTGGYTDVTYGSDVAYPCFVTYKLDEIRDTAGDQQVSMGRAAFAFTGPTALTPDWKVTLPDGSKPRILAVQRDADTVLGITPVTCWF